MGNGKEVIMLAKGFSVPKLDFPVYVSEKLDGVPADFVFFDTKTEDGNAVYPRTRQGELITSIPHILAEMQRIEDWMPDDSHLIGECYIRGMKFKDISGLVRRKQPNAETLKIQLHLFDYYRPQNDEDFEARLHHMMMATKKIGSKFIHMIPQHRIQNEEQLHKFIDDFFKNHPEAEGLVFRNAHGKYRLTRSWDFQKLKQKGTYDLEVVRYEEAVDKHNVPKGMVGAIICNLYLGKKKPIEVRVGAGAMSHAERVVCFETNKGVGDIAEVDFMPDDSYHGGMREARFRNWRPDKTKGD